VSALEYSLPVLCILAVWGGGCLVFWTVVRLMPGSKSPSTPPAEKCSALVATLLQALGKPGEWEIDSSTTIKHRISGVTLWVNSGRSGLEIWSHKAPLTRAEKRALWPVIVEMRRQRALADLQEAQIGGAK
jgi:hypothetical protein